MTVVSWLVLAGPVAAFVTAPRWGGMSPSTALRSSEPDKDTSPSIDEMTIPDDICDVLHCESLLGLFDLDAIWETGRPEHVQGGAVKTFSFPDPRVNRVHVAMKTRGRPLNCNVELWQGPNNAPYRLGVYLEDGCLRPFNAFIDFPAGSNTLALRNVGQQEFPFQARVEAGGLTANPKSSGVAVQGGAVRSFPFDPAVESVQLSLRTDGRPMNARVEVMQGPYNDKQVMEVYIEDGQKRAFNAIIQTPGVGNVVRIVNTAAVEFPFTVSVVPFQVES